MIAAGLALLTRALRLEARSWKPYALRLGLLAVLTLVVMAQRSSAFAGAPGLQLFSAAGFLNLVAVLMIGAPVFASVVTEEREEGTLGLLLMTGMRPVALLLGKSVSRLISVVLIILVQLPFTLLARLLGGISLTQILATYICLLGVAALLSQAGLLASVLFGRSRDAVGATVAVTLGFLVAPFPLQGLLEVADEAGMIAADGAFGIVLARLLEIWAAANPFVQLASIISTGFAGPVVGVPLAVHLGLAVLGFAASWALFLPCARSGGLGAMMGRALRGGTERAARKGARRQSRRVWGPALAWKDFHFVTGGWRAGTLKLLAFAVLAACLFAMVDGQWGVIDCLVALLVASVAFAAFDLAVQAGRFLAVESQAKTWLALGLLPLEPTQIISRKCLGVALGLWPYLLVALIAGVPVGASWIADAPSLEVAHLVRFGVPVALILVVFVWLLLRVRQGVFVVAAVALVVSGVALWMITGDAAGPLLFAFAWQGLTYAFLITATAFLSLRLRYGALGVAFLLLMASQFVWGIMSMIIASLFWWSGSFLFGPLASFAALYVVLVVGFGLATVRTVRRLLQGL